MLSECPGRPVRGPITGSRSSCQPGTHFFGWFDDGVQPGSGVVLAGEGVGEVAVGLGVGVAESDGVGLGVAVGLKIGSGAGVRSAGLDGATVGVDEGATVGTAVEADNVGRARLGTTVIDAVGLGLADGDSEGDSDGDRDAAGPCSVTSDESADATSRPSASVRTSSVDPKVAPGCPPPATARSKDMLPRSSIPVAVSVNGPPGPIETMTMRYVPGTASGRSMSCGSVPGALATQRGTCRSTAAPDAMPHDRPSGSTTTRYAGECMPKRSVVRGAGTAAGEVGAWPGRTVVCCPCVTSTV